MLTLGACVSLVSLGILIGRIAGHLEMSARRSASRHAVIVASALLSGSTQGYTLVEVPRQPNSTTVMY